MFFVGGEISSKLTEESEDLRTYLLVKNANVIIVFAIVHIFSDRTHCRKALKLLSGVPMKVERD